MNFAASMLAATKLKRASAPGTQMRNRSAAHKMWKKPADSGADGGRGSPSSAVAVPGKYRRARNKLEDLNLIKTLHVKTAVLKHQLGMYVTL